MLFDNAWKAQNPGEWSITLDGCDMRYCLFYIILTPADPDNKASIQAINSDIIENAVYMQARVEKEAIFAIRQGSAWNVAHVEVIFKKNLFALTNLGTLKLPTGDLTIISDAANNTTLLGNIVEHGCVYIHLQSGSAITSEELKRRVSQAIKTAVEAVIWDDTTKGLRNARRAKAYFATKALFDKAAAAVQANTATGFQQEGSRFTLALTDFALTPPAVKATPTISKKKTNIILPAGLKKQGAAQTVKQSEPTTPPLSPQIEMGSLIDESSEGASKVPKRAHAGPAPGK